MGRKKYTFVIDGHKHSIRLDSVGFGKPGEILLDGIPIDRSMKGFNNTLFRFTIKINLHGKDVYVEQIGSKLNVAIDGIYVGTEKPYIYRDKPPAWAYVFLLIGALSMVAGFFLTKYYYAAPFAGFMFFCLGLIYIVRISMSSNKLWVRVLLSLLVSIMGWAFFTLEMCSYFYS